MAAIFKNVLLVIFKPLKPDYFYYNTFTKTDNQLEKPPSRCSKWPPKMPLNYCIFIADQFYCIINLKNCSLAVKNDFDGPIL